jgi:hypothetical protein
MEGSNPSSRPARDEFSNLMSEGFILWRFSSRRFNLWCLAFELPDGYYLVVDDNPEGPQPYLIHERHADAIGVMNRAEALACSLRRCGWTEVDVE